MSPQLFLAAVLRRKLLFLFVVLFCTAAAGFMALKTTFTYESSAQILVKPGAREGFSVESATLRGTPIVDRHAYTEFANTLARAVRSGRSYAYFRELATQVATLKPAEVEKVIDRVLKPERSVTMIQGPKTGVEKMVTGAKLTQVVALPDVIHDEYD